MQFFKYQLRYALPIWLVLLMTAFLPDNRYSIKIRGFLVSIFLPNRPKNLTLGRDITLLGVDKLNVGDNVYFAKGTWINALGTVNIGSNVLLSPYVVIASAVHGFSGKDFLAPSKFNEITIENGVWVAAHSTITSGVTICTGSLVSANSTVIKDVPEFTMVSGVPAVVIRKLV
ncbi:acyltransferase [Vibrio antiquarius]|uniref:acyltransferase n=1 Tax=Vibrio antiquarius (strain Ex25) TaxID=150340 RepID=UPI002659B584|nr:acyltransferase [Vibrio antiquarius]MCR9628122.1 acyltransferase [Vibrio antiquarius]MCR9634359.1 acyltransferase [Vibrio antiquarius]